MNKKDNKHTEALIAILEKLSSQNKIRLLACARGLLSGQIKKN